MKEIVIDTNVFVSALINSQGTPRKLLAKIASKKVGLVISSRLLLELVTAFSKPKLRALIPEGKISDLVSLVHESARVVKPAAPVTACRDPKDNAVLECALAGKVSAIVSGDNDLLVLNPFHSIPIIPPKKALELINVL